MNNDNFLNVIKRGIKDLISEQELDNKLKQKKVLRIKYGIDPTSPDIHLGHTVLLRKLRQFQDFGHKILFLIGDFTAKIGDPSGRSETRKPLTDETIKNNYLNYKKYVSQILDLDKVEVVFNSVWLNKLGINGIFELASKYTVARMLERNDFSNRYKNGSPISIIEFLYPLLQGYDSVYLESDIEIGGEDQLFNLLVGRELQKEYRKEQQVIMTMPLLVGLDGKLKMSKSYNNYIGINDSPDEIFGKIMSIPDDIMMDYFTLLTNENLEEIKNLHPKTAKEKLGQIIVERYYSKEKAGEACDNFNKVFQQKEIPENLTVHSIEKDNANIVDIIFDLGYIKSKKEIKRLLLQKAVEVDGRKIENPDEVLTLSELPFTIKIGKRIFFKIKK